MSATIQIIGDGIYFDGQRVGDLDRSVTPSTLFGFMDAIDEAKTEQDIADKINEAEGEAEAEGKRSMLENVREAISIIDFADDNAESQLLERLNELEKEI